MQKFYQKVENQSYISTRVIKECRSLTRQLITSILAIHSQFGESATLWRSFTTKYSQTVMIFRALEKHKPPPRSDSDPNHQQNLITFSFTTLDPSIKYYGNWLIILWVMLLTDSQTGDVTKHTKGTERDQRRSFLKHYQITTKNLCYKVYVRYTIMSPECSIDCRVEQKRCMDLLYCYQNAIHLPPFTKCISGNSNNLIQTILHVRHSTNTLIFYKTWKKDLCVYV